MPTTLASDGPNESLLDLDWAGSVLEEVVECGPGIDVAAAPPPRGEIHSRSRLKVIAEVGFLLVADPLGLRFAALVAAAWVEMPAMHARMEVSSASGASVATPDRVAGHQWQGVAATVAGETKVGHGSRPSESNTFVGMAEGMAKRRKTA